MKPHDYLLSAALGASAATAALSYNIPEISKYLDILNVMVYDLHGPWDPVTGNNAPLFEGPSDVTAADKQLNADFIIKYWLSEGL